MHCLLLNDVVRSRAMVDHGLKNNDVAEIGIELAEFVKNEVRGIATNVCLFVVREIVKKSQISTLKRSL